MASAALLDCLADKFTISDNCWEWTAGRNKHGYGRVWVDGKHRGAHRVVYELLVGPIPAGLQLDHLCRVRHCVRPSHLEPVSGRTNTLRGKSFAAVNAARTACVNGHAFTNANTYQRPGGRGRGCRRCRVEGVQRWRDAHPGVRNQKGW